MRYSRNPHCVEPRRRAGSRISEPIPSPAFHGDQGRSETLTILGSLIGKPPASPPVRAFALALPCDRPQDRDDEHEDSGRQENDAGDRIPLDDDGEPDHEEDRHEAPHPLLDRDQGVARLAGVVRLAVSRLDRLVLSPERDLVLLPRPILDIAAVGSEQRDRQQDSSSDPDVEGLARRHPYSRSTRSVAGPIPRLTKPAMPTSIAEGSQIHRSSLAITGQASPERNSAIPIGETASGRTGKKYRELSKGASSATPSPPSVSASRSPWEAVQTNRYNQRTRRSVLTRAFLSKTTRASARRAAKHRECVNPRCPRKSS